MPQLIGLFERVVLDTLFRFHTTLHPVIWKDDMTLILDTIGHPFFPVVRYHGPGQGFLGQWPHFMPFGGFFFWLLIILAVIVLMAVISKSRRSVVAAESSPSRETPLDILKKRYARGELTKKEFEQMKQDLQ